MHQHRAPADGGDPTADDSGAATATTASATAAADLAGCSATTASATAAGSATARDHAAGATFATRTTAATTAATRAPVANHAATTPSATSAEDLDSLARVRRSYRTRSRKRRLLVPQPSPKGDSPDPRGP